MLALAKRIALKDALATLEFDSAARVQAAMRARIHAEIDSQPGTKGFAMYSSLIGGI